MPEKNLKPLLDHLQPTLHPGEWVFVSTQEPSTHLSLTQAGVIGVFKEMEGISYVISRPLAEKLLFPYSGSYEWITLGVYSDLEAVGLTAAVSTALSESGISCNVIAAIYHDHLFVPMGSGVAAVEVLKALANQEP